MNAIISDEIIKIKRKIKKISENLPSSPLRNKINAKQNEEKDIIDIVTEINNNTENEIKIKIKNSFAEKFGFEIQDARIENPEGKKSGGRNTHYDFEIYVNNEWKHVEHKGSQQYKPIDINLPPWKSGVQFFNGSANKFTIGYKYANMWHKHYIESNYISQKYGIESQIPSCEEWIKQDAMIQGDPKTAFGIELKEKFRKTNPNGSLLEERNEFVQHVFEASVEELTVFKQEVLQIANSVLKEKDYWLQIHGNLSQNFHCEWNKGFVINEILHVYIEKNGSKDVNFVFECDDGFKFGGILRWGKGAGFSNLRIDLK